MIYSFLYSLAALLYLPRVLARKWRDGHKANVAKRLGWDLSPHVGLSPIWIHAVSVGEIKAVRPLAEALLEKGFSLAVSTTTETGQMLARDYFEGRARLLYFPLDWKSVCRRFIGKIRPQLVVLTETELWPNFIRATADAGVPLALVNGRISDRSFRRYRRLGWFFEPLLRSFRLLCMQSKEDKRRILEMGAPEPATHWVGNLKYAYRLEEKPELDPLKSRLESLLKSDGDSLIWICGSTREGEEELLLDVFRQLRQETSQLGLLLAPRHPHRSEWVAEVAARSGFRTAPRSRLEDVEGPLDVVVLDSIGELAPLYACSDIVFIGGSLVPWGGQNVIEPAAHGVPILFGPHMNNFREVAREFTSRYAALQVADPEELRSRLLDLIRDRHARQWLGRNARKVIRDNQGALERTLQFLLPLLGASGTGHNLKGVTNDKTPDG